MKSTRNSLILHKFYKVAFDTSKIACNIMHKNDVYMHFIRRCLSADTCDFRLRTIKIRCFIIITLRHGGVFYTSSDGYGKQQQARINRVAGVVCHY